MVVSVIALVFAMTGTGVAAVSFARNAGAVDGKSAVSAGSSLRAAKGKLVATAASGSDVGRIPAKFLADIPVVSKFGHNQAVPDNSMTGPIELSVGDPLIGIGKLTMTCSDQNNSPGVLDPSSKVTFTNTTGAFMNAAWRSGTGTATVQALAPAAAAEITINGSNTFTYQMEQSGKTIVVDGVVRQDGRNTGSAACLAYGIITAVRP
jgi:hypothetical protein